MYFLPCLNKDDDDDDDDDLPSKRMGGCNVVTHINFLLVWPRSYSRGDRLYLPYHICFTTIISALFLFHASSQQKVEVGGGGVQCCYPYKFPSSVAKEPNYPR